MALVIPLNTPPENAAPQNAATQPSDDLAIDAAKPPSTLTKIFIGADGLRAGWSLLVFAALMAFFLFALNVAGRKFLSSFGAPSPDGSISLRFGLIAESFPFFALLFVSWVMSKIERRPNSVYGLSGRRRLALFFAGLGWGVTCLSLLVLTLWKAGLLVFEQRLLFGSEALRYSALWLLGFLFVGLLEEYLARGYLQYTLTRGLAGIYRWAFKTRHSTALGFWTSALIISFFFGFGHGSNPGESPIGLLSAGLIAMVFCLTLWRTGSLWWAIGFHVSWDWAQSFLYGVADSGIMVQHHLLATHPVGKPILSGGATGPEGSIFVIAILAIVIIIVLFTIPRSGHSYFSTAGG